MCSHETTTYEMEALQQQVAQLWQRQQDLGAILSVYLKEARVDSATRGARAEALSERVTEIVGGEPSSFPECCALGFERANGDIEWTCSGVLIHPRVIVTAGHCGIDRPLPSIAAVGTDSVNSGVGRAAGRFVRRERGLDIGALILHEKVEVDCARLASTDEINALGVMRSIRLAGFGMDAPRRTSSFGVQRNVVTDVRALRRSASDRLITEQREFGFNADLQFVAGTERAGACFRDSGGPGYIEGNGDQGVRVVAGIIGGGRADCADFTILQRVDVHREWIEQQIPA